MRDLAFIAYLLLILAMGCRRPFLLVLGYVYVDLVSPQRLSYYLLNSVPVSLIFFALALLASGFAASSVGTLAGQVVMSGFLHRRIPLMLRRLVTLAPAIVVIAAGVDPTRALVFSQVLLSFGIPFAVVPLVLFTRRRDVMGALVNNRLTTAAAAAVATVIIALNVLLIALTVAG